MFIKDLVKREGRGIIFIYLFIIDNFWGYWYLVKIKIDFEYSFSYIII